MYIFYLGVLCFLFILAIFDLSVGVANDAVNFLSPAVGAKSAKFKTILLVAAIGIFVGASTSSGMMDIARHGILNPTQYAFDDVMCIFLSVAATDVILLDIFNTLGMPTSTTVSMVFGLLGGSSALAMSKILQGGVTYAELINTDKALSVIIGIFLSVAVAFVFGFIVMCNNTAIRQGFCLSCSVQRARSNQDALTVVKLMLDDLRRPAGKGFIPHLKLLVLVLHLNGLPPPGRPHPGKGQAALPDLIRAGAFDDLRVEHHRIALPVLKGDDPLVDPDHICRHAHAALLVGFQGLQKVLCRRQVLQRGGLRLLREECGVLHNFPYHTKRSPSQFPSGRTACLLRGPIPAAPAAFIIVELPPKIKCAAEK